MIKKILLGVALLVAAILILAATRPDSFRIERSLMMQAPPERIYALIADFRQWRQWSPFEDLDPAMKRSYEGAERGRGAVYGWDGDKSGAGRMEIVETEEPLRVSIQLDFLRPFHARNTADLTLATTAEGTQVTWAMHGPDPYIGKLMGLFFDRDQMIGKDFERGLQSLKQLSESPAVPPAAALTVPESGHAAEPAAQ